MMAYSCNLGLKTECDGCMMCNADPEHCPSCGSEDYEYFYKMGYEIIGCSECIEKVWRDW